MNRKIAVVTIFAFSLLITISVLPFLATNGEETGQDTSVEESEFTDANVLGINILGAIRFGLALPFLVAGSMNYAIADFILGTSSSSHDPPAGSDDAVKAFAREMESISYREKLMLISRMGSSFLDNDTQTWGFASQYISRLAELSAGSLWYDGAVFDPDAILEYANIYDVIANANYNSQYTLDWAFDETANRMSVWSSSAWAAGLQAKIGWDSNDTGYASSRLNLDFITAAYSSAGSSVVYLDTDWTAEQAGNYLNNGVFSFQPNATITYIGTGRSTILTQGYNDVSTLPSGLYRLSSGTFAGPFLSSTSASAATTEGAAAIICDNSYGIVTVNSDNSLRVLFDGAVYPSCDDLRYGVYRDGTLDWSETDDISDAIRSYSAYYSQLSEVLQRASVSASVMWQIFAVAKDVNIFLSPSSVIPQLMNVDVDAFQAYAMFMSAMGSVYDYWTTYGTALTSANVRISAESLDLYCYGTIYNADGSVYASNVIFTPYSTLYDMRVRTDHFTQFQSAGMIMIWDTSASSVIGWNGPSGIMDYSYVQMLPGSYFVADEMMYKGLLTDNLTLKVMTVDKMGILEDTFLGIPDTPFVYDAITLFTLIILLTVAVLTSLVLAAVFRSKVILSPAKLWLVKIVVLVDIVLLVIGFLWPEALVNFLYGWFIR